MAEYEGVTMPPHIAAVEIESNREPRDTVRVTFTCRHSRVLWRLAFDSWFSGHMMVPMCGTCTFRPTIPDEAVRPPT